MRELGVSMCINKKLMWQSAKNMSLLIEFLTVVAFPAPFTVTSLPLVCFPPASYLGHIDGLPCPIDCDATAPSFSLIDRFLTHFVSCTLSVRSKRVCVHVISYTLSH